MGKCASKDQVGGSAAAPDAGSPMFGPVDPVPASAVSIPPEAAEVPFQGGMSFQGYGAPAVEPVAAGLPQVQPRGVDVDQHAAAQGDFPLKGAVLVSSRFGAPPVYNQQPAFEQATFEQPAYSQPMDGGYTLPSTNYGGDFNSGPQEQVFNSLEEAQAAARKANEASGVSQYVHYQVPNQAMGATYADQQASAEPAQPAAAGYGGFQAAGSPAQQPLRHSAGSRHSAAHQAPAAYQPAAVPVAPEQASAQLVVNEYDSPMMGPVDAPVAAEPVMAAAAPPAKKGSKKGKKKSTKSWAW